MSTFTVTSNKQKAKAREPGIQSGDLVLFKLPKGDVRSIKVEQHKTVTIPKFASFHADELIGQPYGISYEIVDKTLKYLPPRSLQEVEDTDATNELINDEKSVQPLTVQEIQALKKSGVHGDDIIKMQIEQHANYSLKTEYSKEKYKKRKEAKYLKKFTTIEPTFYNVCEYWFLKDQNRIRDLRVDSISQMLNLANVRPGGRYLVVDDASGIIVAGVLDRMGGEGKLITICNTDSPPAYPAVWQMNFDSSVTDVMVSLNWATAEEDYTPIMAPLEVPEGDLKSERQKWRLGKRKILSDLLHNTREDLFSGEFDSILISSEFDPFSILERLAPYLAGSASIVVHSPFSEIVVGLQAKLRNLPQYLSPTVTEAWLRQYQVLPGRTHPMMVMSGSGGFIMHAIKIYDNPEASYGFVQRRRKPRRKDAETTESISESQMIVSEDATMLSGPRNQTEADS